MNQILPARPVFRDAKTRRDPADNRFPHIRDGFAVLYVAVSIVLVSYSYLFGPLAIVALYALWLPRVFSPGRFVLRPTPELYLPLAFILFSIVSVAWSDYRSVTLRGALESLSMFACTVIIARMISFGAFLRGLIIGVTCVLIVTLIDGQYGADPFSGKYALVGLFGSKNQVGFFAEIGIFTALVFLFKKSGWVEKFFFSFLPGLICCACMIMSSSASSIITLAATLGLCGLACLLAKYMRRTGSLAFIALGLMIFIVAAVGVAFDLQNDVLRAFGKDATLTGRTYLWGEGLKIGMKDPVIGHGYQGFWVIGQPEAERYWYEFFIGSRAGFHFHNLFIQTFVDLGAVGLTLMALMVIRNCLRSHLKLMRDGINYKAVFLLGISFMLLARAFVEVDVLEPFGIGPLLFYYIVPCLALTGGTTGRDVAA